tara:strand:- start:864 stop:1157 length:294 start_codon:yes stop_codon:yes gene_type:complete
MKKGPFKMKTFSGFGNESPVKHNKVAEEVGMLRPDGGMNSYNSATGKYMRPGDMSFGIGPGIKRTADIGYRDRKTGKFHSYLDKPKKSTNPTGAKIF